jgi:hypothetical protein
MELQARDRSVGIVELGHVVRDGEVADNRERARLRVDELIVEREGSKMLRRRGAG